MIDMLRATDVVALDEIMSTAYNGFDSLEHFYADMGALGDIPMHVLLTEPSISINNSTNTSDILTCPLPASHRYDFMRATTPTCILHSFDDPISTWRTNAANEGLLNPNNFVRAANVGNNRIALLLTGKGGHIGWPTGWLPFRRNWEFMNEAAASFVEAVAAARSNMSHHPMK